MRFEKGVEQEVGWHAQKINDERDVQSCLQWGIR